MATPFVFTTPSRRNTQLQPVAQPSAYVQPYYVQQPHTPVIPAAVPIPGVQISPIPQPVLLPPSPGQRVQARPRSWHDAPAGYYPMAVTPPQAVIPVHPPSPYLVAPPLGQRRASFGGAQPPVAMYSYEQPQMYYYPGQPVIPAAAAPVEPGPQIHPLLDGRTDPPAEGLYFDLSSVDFKPKYRHRNGELQDLSDGQLDDPATHPGISKMKIKCPGLMWEIPIEIEQPPPAPALGLEGMPAWARDRVVHASEVPITLRDVLEIMYLSLQNQVTHVEWGKLSRSEEAAVGRAYTRRIRNAGEAGEEEQILGVKRIDYLLDKFMFRGLKPKKDGDFSECEMVVSRAGR